MGETYYIYYLEVDIYVVFEIANGGWCCVEISLSRGVIHFAV